MGVGHPVVVVEDHDGGHAARGNHEHDGSEVCPWRDIIQKLLIPHTMHESQTLQREMHCPATDKFHFLQKPI